MKTSLFRYAVFIMWFPYIAQSQEQVYSNFENIRFENVAIEDDDGLTLRENAEQIYEDENGIIWTVISTGLYRYNGYSVINVTKYLAEKYKLEFGNEFGQHFYVEDENTIWYGARRGLFKIDLSTHSAKKIVLDSSINDKNFRNYITRFHKSNDTLYVGTGNGLYSINTKTDSIMDRFLNDGKDFGWRYSNKSVHSIMPHIERGYLWVAFADGLYRINIATKKTEQYKTTTEVWENSHNYYKSNRYDSILLMPSYGMGMVGFNLNSKTFTDYTTNTSIGNGWDYNVVRSAVKLSDSISLVNVMNLGNALFNRYSKKYTFIETPFILKLEGCFIDVDRSGYAWAGQSGRLYRTTKPIIKEQKPFNHIIDIAKFSANGIIKYRPALDGYNNLKLNENETSIELAYSLSKPFIYDSIQYEYRKDNGEWTAPDIPNKLTFFDLDKGSHQISIRAKRNGSVLASRLLTFTVYQPFYKNVYFISLCFLLLFALGFGILEFQNRKKRKQMRLKSEFDRKLTELEAKALRSQINPHFIFNTLNSIKYYAIKKSKEETTDFITTFSTLIRQVLENSKQSLVPLNVEIETLISYIEIEKLRFRDSFKYTIYKDEEIPDEFLIPPMIIQPFIENAIWHGLMHKQENRELVVEFLWNENTLHCIVKDNGIGRKAAEKIAKGKPHKSSLGIKITEERLAKLSELYNLKSSFKIVDLFDEKENPVGTKVIIEFVNI